MSAMLLRSILFRAVGLLPTTWNSALGAKLVKSNVYKNRPDILAGARANLIRHFPDRTPEAIEAMIPKFLDGVGRLMGEYAVMHRMIPQGRLEPVGLEAFKREATKGPLLVMGLHTGNWETFGPMFSHAGIPLTSFYAPPLDPFDRKVAEECRITAGVGLLSPDASGVRQAMRLLRKGEVVMIFPDEARDGVIMGPLFGRKPHLKGNLAIATRLARHTGARIAICHSERIGSVRFRLNFGEPFALPERDGEDALADVAFLNAAIEPIIRANLPRWYFLDDRLDEVE